MSKDGEKSKHDVTNGKFTQHQSSESAAVNRDRATITETQNTHTQTCTHTHRCDVSHTYCKLTHTSGCTVGQATSERREDREIFKIRRQRSGPAAQHRLHWFLLSHPFLIKAWTENRTSLCPEICQSSLKVTQFGDATEPKCGFRVCGFTSHNEIFSNKKENVEKLLIFLLNMLRHRSRLGFNWTGKIK